MVGFEFHDAESASEVCAVPPKIDSVKIVNCVFNHRLLHESYRSEIATTQKMTSHIISFHLIPMNLGHPE